MHTIGRRQCRSALVLKGLSTILRGEVCKDNGIILSCFAFSCVETSWRGSCGLKGSSLLAGFALGLTLSACLSITLVPGAALVLALVVCLPCLWVWIQLVLTVSLQFLLCLIFQG